MPCLHAPGHIEMSRVTFGTALCPVPDQSRQDWKPVVLNRKYIESTRVWSACRAALARLLGSPFRVVLTRIERATAADGRNAHMPVFG